MDIEAELATAIDHHRHGRFDAAEAGYDAILETEPGHVHTLSVSAILLFQRRKHDEAIARLEGAIALAPDNAALHNNLANMLRETGRLEEALGHYSAAVEAEPEHVEAHCNIGLICRQLGKVEEAIAAFGHALEIDPGHAESHHNLAMTYAIMGKVEEAADHVERCYDFGRIPVIDPLWHVRILHRYGRHERALEIAEMHARSRPDDPIAQHQLAALRGDSVDRASDAYVRKHFDSFASSFDSTLKDLEYRAPQLVAEQVGVLCGSGRVPVIADLGCGTGLVGPLVRDRAEVLVGIDLSGEMLARAAARESADGSKIYDQLVEGELTAFLENVEPGRIDLAVSADTLVYFGPLETVLAGARRAIRPGGALIATVEQIGDDDETGFRLLESGRYGHSEPYIVAQAEAAGFKVRGIHLVGLRREFGKHIRGILCVLENGPDGGVEAA